MLDKALTRLLPANVYKITFKPTRLNRKALFWFVAFFLYKRSSLCAKLYIKVWRELNVYLTQESRPPLYWSCTQHFVTLCDTLWHFVTLCEWCAKLDMRVWHELNVHLTRESGLSLYWSIAKRQGEFFYCFTLYIFFLTYLVPNTRKKK